MTRERGFSLLEAVVALTLMMAAIACVFTLIDPNRTAVYAQTEAADMQQRLRVAADTIFHDVLSAAPHAPLQPVDPSLAIHVRPTVMPFRRGRLRSDPPGTYRGDLITVVRTSLPGDTAAASHTYYLQTDRASGTPRLMRYNGNLSDAPLVDHVVALSFEYIGESPRGAERLDAAQLTDGPWWPDSAAPDRFDADLLRVRTVRVQIRVEAALARMRGAAGALFSREGSARGSSFLPDLEVQFDVSSRNHTGR